MREAALFPGTNCIGIAQCVFRLFEPKNSEEKSEFKISDYLSGFLK